MRGHVKVEKAETHPEWMCQNGEMSWNLKIDKKVAFNVGYGAGKLFRKIQLFEIFWNTEGMKTAYSGEVIWSDEKYMVSPETCYGYSDKNWGKDFTSPWVWLSSNNLTSKITGKKLTDSVFDIGGGCPKLVQSHSNVNFCLPIGMKENVTSLTSQNFGRLHVLNLIAKKPIRRLFGTLSRKRGAIEW